MRLFVCLILIFSASLAPCQSEVDSLCRLIELSPADTTRMKLMLDLAYIYEFENRDSAITIYDRTFALAQTLNNDLYCGRAFQYRSIVMHDMGRYAESIVGNNKALPFFEKINYEKGIASTRNNIGNSYLYLADYQNALKYYLLAKPYFTKQQDYLSLVSLLGNMSECYRQLNESSNMLAIARESYRCATATGDSLEMAHAGISMASALTLNNQPDSSEMYLMQSLRIAESIQNPQILFYVLFDLADSKLNKDRASEALPIAQRALDAALRNANGYQETGAHLLLGKILTRIPGQQTAALLSLQNGMKLAIELNAQDQRLLLLSAFADYYESMNDAQNALMYRKDWIALNDSIFNTEKARQINELHTLYELEEKEQAIANEKLLNQKKDEQIHTRNLQIGIVLSLALLALTIAWFVWKSQRNKRKLAEQEAIILQQKNDSLLKEQKAIQLKSLIEGQEEERTRMARELHDGLGGYLTSVHMKAQQLEANNLDAALAREVKEMVATAGKEMRKISHAMAPEGLLRLGLVETLHQYISKITTSSCPISFETHGESWPSDAYSELTVYRIVQELINNMLKHSSATEGFVSLSFLPHELHVVVEDNGKGFNPDDISSRGHGLSNLKARITYLNATLDLISKPGKGSSFTITIPKADV